MTLTSNKIYHNLQKNKINFSKIPVIIDTIKKNNKIFHLLFSSKIMLFFVVIPNFLSVIYWGFIASAVYQSDSVMIVTNPNKDSDSLTSILAGNAGASTAGAYILKDRLLSWDEFKSVNKQFDIAKTYHDADFVARFGGLSSLWQSGDIDLWDYYRAHVGIDINEQSGITKVTVSAWSNNAAHRIAVRLVQDAVDHLNRLNKKEDQDFISTATSEVARFRKEVAEDTAAIAAWRSQTGHFTPSSDYAAFLGQALTLDEQHLILQGQYLSLIKEAPGSPSAISFRTRMNIIDSGANAARNIARTLFPAASQYESLEFKRDTDVKLLMAAETALQEARIKASQNHYYLKMISAPSEPQSPSGPHRLRWIVIVLATTLILRTLLA
ncbi:hypothetical protein [Granulibacter bethesdensis]|uniref:hypothetical protein n=1 Tax=Granulibacter bethesdensis TaxID=364410 RepID=UPI0003F1EC5C|nr:hypothetical protein [Granulibacter bethesdensis]AHJ65862.1 Capsule polysaccharide export protein [Granulibacter bethesdensis CGDNIH4]APH60014.1 Capsule polysaccharide export protein [Granulibacter bethesdensis]